MSQRAGRRRRLVGGDLVIVVVFARAGGVDPDAVAEDPGDGRPTGASSPTSGRCRTTRTSSRQGIFTDALRNSIGIALISTSLAVLLACAAAYAIARLDFPGKRVILVVALAVAMFPQVSLVGPLYNLWRQIGLYDTWPGLIIPYMTFALPLSIYTLSAFFREIPWELEQAAQVDGATPFQAFRKVIAPLATPGIVDDLHHRLHHLLERLHLRDLADLDLDRADGAGGDRPVPRRLAVHRADR